MTFVEFLQLFGVGGSAGAIVAWLGREWISTRLKQAIEYEYSAKLEAVRNDFNLKLQGLAHENEVARLRTSLFFDHQRSAFAAILEQIEAVNDAWRREGYDSDRNEWQCAVPFEGYQLLRQLCVKHQLFLDADSMMALGVLLTAYAESYPDDGADGQIDEDNCRDAFGRAWYVQRRLTGIFQQQIGVDSHQRALLEIAILGGAMRINTYYSSTLPDDSPFRLTHYRSADVVVSSALSKMDDMKARLAGFIRVYEKRSEYQEQVSQVVRFLSVFERFSV